MDEDSSPYLEPEAHRTERRFDDAGFVAALLPGAFCVYLAIMDFWLDQFALVINLPNGRVVDLRMPIFGLAAFGVLVVLSSPWTMRLLAPEGKWRLLRIVSSALGLTVLGTCVRPLLMLFTKVPPIGRLGVPLNMIANEPTFALTETLLIGLGLIALGMTLHRFELGWKSEDLG